MTEAAVGSTESVEQSSDPSANGTSDERLIAMLVDRARTEGLELTGEGGLLRQLTKRVLGSALGARSLTTSAMTSTTWPGSTAATPRNGTLGQDRDYRRRSGRGSGAPRYCRHLRAADRQEAAALPVWSGRDGVVAVG